jgi:two-component system nitrate/nitrite response regulator NarL
LLRPREREVLELLVDACDTHGVAGRMGVTNSTARTHIQNVLTKIGFHSKLELVALATKHVLARASFD